MSAKPSWVDVPSASTQATQASSRLARPGAAAMPPTDSAELDIASGVDKGPSALSKSRTKTLARARGRARWGLRLVAAEDAWVAAEVASSRKGPAYVVHARSARSPMCTAASPATRSLLPTTSARRSFGPSPVSGAAPAVAVEDATGFGGSGGIPPKSAGSRVYRDEPGPPARGPDCSLPPQATSEMGTSAAPNAPR